MYTEAIFSGDDEGLKQGGHIKSAGGVMSRNPHRGLGLLLVLFLCSGLRRCPASIEKLSARMTFLHCGTDRSHASLSKAVLWVRRACCNSSLHTSL